MLSMQRLGRAKAGASYWEYWTGAVVSMSGIYDEGAELLRCRKFVEHIVETDVPLGGVIFGVQRTTSLPAS
jgi:hypothetical protein